MYVSIHVALYVIYSVMHSVLEYLVKLFVLSGQNLKWQKLLSYAHYIHLLLFDCGFHCITFIMFIQY